MKFWLKNSITVFLCVLILATGSGLSLAKMVCLKSGYTSITLNVPDDCCETEEHTAALTIEEKCCDISSMDIDILQYLVSATQNIEKSVVWFDAPSALSFFGSAQNNKASSIKTRHADDPVAGSSSPPIRILTKTFLI